MTMPSPDSSNTSSSDFKSTPGNACSQSSTSQTGPSAACSFGGACNFNAIKDRAIDIITNPKSCWDRISTEQHSVSSLYSNYLVYIVGISVLCQFVRNCMLGISVPFMDTWRMPIMSGLIYHVLLFAASLATLYIWAFVFEKLAATFKAKVSIAGALALVGYASTPAILGGVLSLLPLFIAGIASLILGIYSLYILYQGLPRMTAVPNESRIGYFAVGIVCSFIVSLVFMFVVNAIAYPSMPMPDMKMPGGTGFNQQEIQKGLDMLKQFSGPQ